MVGSIIYNPYTQTPFAEILWELNFGDLINWDAFMFFEPDGREYVEKVRPSWFEDQVLRKIWESGR